MNKSFSYSVKNSLACVKVAKIMVLVLLFSGIAFHGFSTAWTTNVAGPVNVLANWTNGMSTPTTFTTPGDTWTVTLNMTMPSAAIWNLGTVSSAPDTLIIASGGTLGFSGAGGAVTINVYGDVIVNGGTFTLGGAGTTETVNVHGGLLVSSGTVSSTGSSTSFHINTNGLDTLSGGSIASTGAGSTITLINNGNFSVSAGTVNASSTITLTDTGNFSMTGGTLSAGGTLTMTINGNSTVTNGNLGGIGTMTMTTNGNTTISGGIIKSNGAGSNLFMNTHGSFVMTGGTFGSSGAGSTVKNTVYGNCSYSGPCSMTNTGAGCTSTVYLALNTTLGTMMVDNTSTGAWSATNVYVDAGCTAQLDGNFSSSTGSGTYGVTVNGTLICPAAYMINGTGIFTVDSGATLEVAHATGINGAIITTGTKTFNTQANYVFNGTVAQVTGSYLPASLVTPDSITISNSAGVTLTQSTLTTGTLLFTSGILNTGAFTMSVPGAASAVVGAGATSYVNGTLIKTITGLSSVNYEVGDLNYAPMLLAMSTIGTAGSLGIKTTNGLHPSVATSGLSSANMANHYWTISNIGAAGPSSVIPKATYNLVDIIGGSNAAFLTQEYIGTAWLGIPLTTTNTSSPYVSYPNGGIPLGTLAGAYIFGNTFCGTLPITGTTTVCTGSTTALHDATTGGTWSSSAPAVATISGTGVVTGVTAGVTTITYAVGACAVTTVVTVNTAPVAGSITGSANVCVGHTDNLADATPGGTWSSSAPATGSVSVAGVVTGIAAGTTTISYTVTNACGTATATMNVTVHSPASCALLNGNVSTQLTQALNIFPNPNSGAFTLNLVSAGEEAVHVIITNVVGEKVKEIITTTNRATDISLDSAPGIYLLSASTAHGRYNAKVLVK